MTAKAVIFAYYYYSYQYGNLMVKRGPHKLRIPAITPPIISIGSALRSVY